MVAPAASRSLALTASEVSIRDGQIHVTKASKTGKATMSIFRGIHKDISLVCRSHECLFNLRIIRIGGRVTHFSGKAGTSEKDLIRPIAFDDRQRLSQKYRIDQLFT